MRVVLSLVLAVCLKHANTFSLQESSSQQEKAKPADQQPASAPAVVKQPLAFGLEDGTPIKLRLNRTISSADAHVNDTVDFDVLEEVQVHGDIVVPRGGMAWGTVTEAEPKRRMARGGKLNVNIDDVRLASGEKVPLRAGRQGRRPYRRYGGSHGRDGHRLFAGRASVSFHERQRHHDTEGNRDHGLHQR
jgi:hypothetical protein